MQIDECDWHPENSEIDGVAKWKSVDYPHRNYVYQLMCEGTIKHAASKGRHNYTLTVDEIFICF